MAAGGLAPDREPSGRAVTVHESARTRVTRLFLPGRQKIGLLWTLLLGVIGSLIGGTIANALRSGSIWELNFVGFVAAVVASVLVLAVAERSGMLASGERGRLTR